MKIQLITYEKPDEHEYRDLEVSTISNPKSLDEFEINIIDLSSGDIWKYSNHKFISIDTINDFKSIATMIENARKTKIIYVLPQNVKVYWSWSDYEGDYSYCEPLKNVIEPLIQRILPIIMPSENPIVEIFFEPTKTTIGKCEYISDFCFTNNYVCVTKSDISEKQTTIKICKDIYATTLNITYNRDTLINYINALFVKSKNSKLPNWIEVVEFDDDKEQKTIIENNKKVISEANKNIDNAKAKLQDNLRYKSILYTNGDELVDVVFEILEKLLDYDLSAFVDVNKEDFLVRKSNCTFIGEIKGVTSNIKNEHISQVDLHYQKYRDKLNEEGNKETVQQLLIMNPLRMKEISGREPVNEEQINLAKRNGCLIIETITLLKLFEKYLKGEVDTNKCEEILASKVGILRVSDFDDVT